MPSRKREDDHPIHCDEEAWSAAAAAAARATHSDTHSTLCHRDETLSCAARSTVQNCNYRYSGQGVSLRLGALFFLLYRAAVSVTDHPHVNTVEVICQKMRRTRVPLVIFLDPKMLPVSGTNYLSKDGFYLRLLASTPSRATTIRRRQECLSL
jgi:hypothetical protein